MKSLKSKILAIPATILLVGSLQAQSVDVTYGSGLDFGAFKASLFTNEAQTGFDASTTGLIAFGYFDDGFDVATEAAGLDDTTYSAFISSFNMLAESNFNGVGSSSGFLTASGNFTPDATGKTGYLLTLAGVTSFASAASATEIGLFRDAAFSTIPALGDPVPADYSIDSLTYDSVLLGTEYLDETLGGVFTGFTGNLYATQTIAAAVPEPSTYALLMGAASFGFVYYRRRVASKKVKETQVLA